MIILAEMRPVQSVNLSLHTSRPICCLGVVVH